MQNKKSINIKLIPHDEKTESSKEDTVQEKFNFGTSALFGRTQRNVTFHQRGAYDETKFDNAFPGAYLNIIKSSVRMFLMLFKSK